VRGPLQIWREFRCDYRYWAKRGLMPNQLAMSDSVWARHYARHFDAQYRPCVKCGCPRYYHGYPGPVHPSVTKADHWFTDGPLELLDADRR